MTARIPFALLGVVLLVGSATLVGTLQQPVVSEPDVERAMDRVSAQSQTALRDAVTSAMREAARRPVTVRADTDYGRVLNRSSAFRDSLRIRIYLRVRESLETITTRQGDVTARVSVPRASTPAELRRAKHRVEVQRAGTDGTSVRVHLEDVRLTAHRGNRRVADRTISPTLFVRSPTLAVHDRVQLFERRLDASPLSPGLGRHLTGSLYPVVWVRGYAQYKGAPIENVLGNHHVALFTNSGVLSVQRNVFGHSDPAGRYVLGRALAHAALTDILAGVESRATDYLLQAHEKHGLTPKAGDALRSVGDIEPPSTPDENVTVAVNESADRLFLDSHAALDETLGTAYSARVSFRQSVDRIDRRRLRDPRDPDTGWRHLSTDNRTTVEVRDRAVDAAAVEDPGTHVLDTYARTVVKTTETARHWQTPQGRVQTVGRTRTRYAVRFRLIGNHTLGPAPVRPIDGVHEPGGPLDGRNLADVPPAARERLVAARGGVDSLARAAVAGRNLTATTVLKGERPDGLSEWVYPDLVAVRERVRNVSMTTTRGKLATYQANPPARLANKLQRRRSTLIDAPETYRSVAGRARVAARAEYVDRVIGALGERAARRTEAKDAIRDTLPNSSGDPLARLQESYRRRNNHTSPDGLAGIEMRVDAEPAYLTRSAVSGQTVPAIPADTQEHPLVVRNVNLVTLPYGDLVDAIIGAILGPKKTRLRTGAQTLYTIEQAVESAKLDRSDLAVANPRKLRAQVVRGTEVGIVAARTTLAEFDLGTEASREATVRRALSRWDSPGSRGLAMTNGSAADAIYEAAVDRWSGQLSDRSRDLLAIRLHWDIKNATAREFAKPAQPAVNQSRNRFREAVSDELASQVGDGVKNAARRKIAKAAGRSLSRLPAGLPVAPAPGFWYATVNLWHVEVAGEYARFTVRVPRGTPDDPRAEFRYVRQNASVALDVDGDGRREQIGRSTRISFRTGTEVAIAVPPGPQGVGDIDGKMFEESAGWPDPGG